MDLSKADPSAGSIELDARDVLPHPAVLLRRSRRYREGSGQKIAQAVDEALGLARPLLEPRAVWALRPVDLGAGRLPPLPEELAARLTLHFGVVCTVGGRLEGASQQQFRDQHFALGYWLDQVGTFSVSLLAQQIASQLCRQYGAIRWAPGDSADDQSFEAQAELFHWVPAERIGVSLTSHNVMRPVKSLSFNLYAGPDLRGVECLVACSHCVWDGACDRQR